MSFEIQELTKAPLEGLKSLGGKKTGLIIGVVVVAGLFSYYLKKKNASIPVVNSESATASTTSDGGAIVADQYLNSLNSLKQNYETQISGQTSSFNSALEKLKSDSNNSIQGLTNYYSGVISQDEEKIKTLQTQMTSTQDTFKTQLEQMQKSLLQELSNRANVPTQQTAPASVYTPPSSSSGNYSYTNDSTPYYGDDVGSSSGVGSYGNDGSYTTPSTPQEATPDNNPYNANTNTGDYTYGGVDYSQYDGSEKWSGTPEESAYWNNFINS